MQRIMRCAIVVALFLAAWGSAYAQKEDYVWFFGDSLLLDFNSEPPVVLPIARLSTWRTSTAISDSSGSLLFYMNQSKVLSVDHEVVASGVSADYLDQSSWVLPIPRKQGEYCIIGIGFRACPSPTPCVNTNLLIQTGDTTYLAYKNRIHQNNMCPKVAVTRHANGQDYWVVTHERNSRRFFTFLLTQYGIEGPYVQTIGSVIGEIDNSYIGHMKFSPSGEKLALAGHSGVVELFDFDRCTGLLSNYQQINAGGNFGEHYFGCAFSGSGNRLYLTLSRYPEIYSSSLVQLNLEAPDIWASLDTIWTSSIQWDEAAQLELGPDQRIYMTHARAVNFQLADTINQYLSVINSPDSLGMNCDPQIHSISLLPYRSTLALPNFPNYRLGPITLQPANAGPNQKICLGDSIQIGTPDTSSIPLVYNWWPTTGLDDPISPTPMASPQSPTTYFLTVTDTSKLVSCNFTEDSMSVTIDLCWYGPNPEREVREQLPVITNLITQNGDGVDETFEIRWVPVGTKVRIFDTWGRVLFVSESYQNDWPQRSVGSGVYYYEVRFPGSEEALVGKILVVGE